MTARKKSTKTGGGDSTSVSSTKREMVGGKKKSDYSTDYNKKNLYHKQPTPGYPYGQQHMSKSMAKPGAGKVMNSKAIATNTKKK